MDRGIEVRSLDCHFGTRAALTGVDLVVRRGNVHGVLGPTGAGKTVLLRLLAGELAPSAGSLRLPDHVTLVAAQDGPALSPIEAQLTRGSRRRVALARAVAGAPDVLLADEPPEGFDDATAAATRSLAQRHAAAGGAVVWATRRLDVLLGLASGVTVLARGRVRYAGTAEALADRALHGIDASRLTRFDRAA